MWVSMGLFCSGRMCLSGRWLLRGMVGVCSGLYHPQALKSGGWIFSERTKETI